MLFAAEDTSHEHNTNQECRNLDKIGDPVASFGCIRAQTVVRVPGRGGSVAPTVMGRLDEPAGPSGLSNRRSPFLWPSAELTGQDGACHS